MSLLKFEYKSPYVGLGRRLCAKLLDILVLVPLLLLVNPARVNDPALAIAMIPCQAVIFYVYNLYLHATSGQTLGKWIVRIKVVAPGGTRPGWRRSSLRNLDDLVQATVMSVATGLALRMAPAAQYASLSFGERGKLIKDLSPGWQTWAEVVIYAWLSCEILLIVFTEKRRALHDLIGGTTVIRVGRKDENEVDRTVASESPAKGLP